MLLTEATAATLTEAATRDDDGTVRLRIIGPGWSANGRYYSADVLRESAPLFTAGTHTYIDHPSRTETSDRPERSLRDLAGTLTTDATWDEAGPAGPGLYANAEIRDEYRPLIGPLADHIGPSIRAQGVAEHGQAEGRTGPVVTSITSVESVDYVTRPAAGGRVMQLIESVRDSRIVPLDEARNAGQWFESLLHLDFTERADRLAADGHLTRDERIALSSAIGDALAAFSSSLEVEAPHLYQRDPYDQPDPAPALSESGRPGGSPMPEHTTGDQQVALTEARQQLAEAEARATAAETELARRRDADRAAEERAAVTEAVNAAPVPDTYQAVADRIRDRARPQVSVTRDDQGAIVGSAVAESARAAVQAEVDALIALDEARGAGRPNGVGPTGDPGAGTFTSVEDYIRAGLTEADARIAAGHLS